MNETPKGKYQRLLTKKKRGYDELCNADIDWLFQHIADLQCQLDTINDDIPKLKARLSAQTDQVYRV